MNAPRRLKLARLLAILLPILAAAAHAAPAASSIDADAAAEAPSAAAAPSDASDDEKRPTRRERPRRHEHHDDNDRVAMGHDADLPSGEQADSVVAIFGSVTSAGEAGDVVSIFGNTRISGPVHDDAVAVFGSSYIDNTVGGDVVALFGNVQLGPHAVVDGDVVAIGGTVLRDPNAVVDGTINTMGGKAGGFEWLRPWIDHCLFYGRPLALVPGVGWAWGLALSLWVLYLFCALAFPGALIRCVQTLELRPGLTSMTALLAVLLVPILLVLLCVTVIGIAAVPFVVLALLCAGFFGKAVMLAWVGRRCLGERREGPLGHPAMAVLLGGLIVLALYLVPVLGFVTYKLLGFFGFGAVVYTLVLGAQARRGARVEGPGEGAAAATTAAATTAAVAGPQSSPAAAAQAEAVAATPGAATPLASTPLVNAALPRAGFWVRIVALLLDVMIVGLVMGVLNRGFHLELLVLAAYGAVMWKLRGATLGDIVFDLRVVRLDGRPVDWETAVVRALGCFLSLAVAGLGFFWIVFDEGKQAWHDKIAGTVVVRVPKHNAAVFP